MWSAVLGNESAAASATRATAVWINGTNCAGYSTNCNGASYNAIAFAGTAAINLQSSGQSAYGNLLQQNRYEISAGSGGG